MRVFQRGDGNFGCFDGWVDIAPLRRVEIVDLSNAERVVIIGAGQAAAQACASLRQFGFAGAITIIGDEAALPYQRPPLSKAYMKGELAEERLYFKPAAWYEDQNIDPVLSMRATKIDRAAQTVGLEHGGSISYDALIIATGSRPRPLPVEGADLDGVFDLRDLADVERIRPRMIAGQKLVIVGAGYIGLEAAAVARQLDLDVTVLEMEDRVLARVTSPIMSEFFEAEHSRQGATIKTGARLASLQGADGKVTTAVLADGSSLEADIVLVGIGILPNVELAEEAGIACSNGILTDRDARTNDPRVFAAGDCAARPLVHYGRDGRLESVHNAIEQGKLAAAAIMGDTESMAKIIYVDHEGTERAIEAANGESVMEAAIKNSIPGIDADCGGACACATCHVYVDEAFLEKVGTAEDMEQSIVDLVSETGVAAQSIFAFGLARESALNFDDMPMPDVPAPEDIESFFDKGRPRPGFTQNFDMLLATGGRPVSGSDDPAIGLWMRHLDPKTPQDATAILAIGDAPPPAAMSMLKVPGRISSMTWMAEFMTDDIQTDPEGWYFAQHTAQLAKDGYSSQSMRLWNRHGQPILACAASFESAIDAHGTKPASLGIASFGPVGVDPDSADYGIITGTAKPGWNGAAIGPKLSHLLDLPFKLDTDVNGALAAEMRWGRARDVSQAAYMTVGTGIGVGICLDGAYLGRPSHPEFGHIRVTRHPDDDGFAGICALHGDCLEGLASAPAITARWGDPEQLSEDHIGWEIEAFYLAQACLNLYLPTRLQRIILGGGIMSAPGLLLRVQAAFDRLMGDYLPIRGDALIQAPKLGAHAGVLGGAVLAFDAIS
eukprot:g2890.t1